MNKKHSHSIFLILLIVVISLGNYFFKKEMDKSPVIYSKCRISTESCEVLIGGMRLKVFIKGEVKALQHFSVHIIDKNNLVQQAMIRFRMKEMDMGVNQYGFIKNDAHNWIADVVIPVCTTGRRDWVAELELYQGAIKNIISFEMEI